MQKFKPKTKEERDTLAPIGFFRVGEKEEQKNQKIAEAIKKAAEQLGRKKLTKGQEKLVRMQAEAEQPYTQDVPSTAIKGIKYDPKTQDLFVTFQGGSKKYWYPRVPKEKVEEMLAAPSKGEYFMQNIHNQYSVNYQNHKSHEHQGYLGSNRQIARYYRKMRKAYDKGMKAGTMKGVLNNERS
jgi:vacuolar-type H+-ATPase subunit D/Vma8